MFPTTSEQSRRLDAEITHLLLSSIEQTSLVRLLEDIASGFDELLLGGGGGLSFESFGVEMLEDGSEIAFREIFNLRSVRLCAR